MRLHTVTMEETEAVPRPKRKHAAARQKL
jgi:hypothetical protein